MPEAVAHAVGWFETVLESTPLLRSTMVPPEIRPLLDASLGHDQTERLIAEGRQLAVADMAQLVLDAITEVLASADGP